MGRGVFHAGLGLAERRVDGFDRLGAVAALVGVRGLQLGAGALKEVERTLREQIEALKEVERTIRERGQESQPRRK